MLADARGLEKRFTLVTGKGGVGKTTVAALLAARFAKNGHRTLLCELNTRPERLAPMFGHPPVGPQIAGIAPNLWCVNMDPSDAMVEYGLLKLKLRALCKLFFENTLVQSLVALMPGVSDLVMLGKAFNHEREREKQRPLWDRIVIDAPATGHGIPFFRLPQSICEAVCDGNLYREARAMQQLLDDPERTVVHLVTLPQALPVMETLQLYRRLKTELNLPLGCLFVNRMPRLGFSAEEEARLRVHSGKDAFWEWAARCMDQEEIAQKRLKPLNDVELPVIELPEIWSDRFGPGELSALLGALEARLKC